MSASTPRIKGLDDAVRAELQAGIVDPVPTVLHPPLRLCRFTDRKFGHTDGLVSPWWITENDFLKVVAARERSRQAHAGDKSRGLSLGFVARWAAAIPQEWQTAGKPGKPTTVDLLLRADLLVSVDAFVGRGRAQQETAPNGINLKWSGWPQITQLFIPAFSKRQKVPATAADVIATMAIGAPTYIVSRQLYG